ncbi:hypothetical protein AW14_09180 [Siansivirga zeaxanthinifaciens CC-SAMT-1]|uniref:Uncharacterized protein n=1 Tax=Siansivirga zeaxanthinifaciens CC-SAMT-1 TaxID=1454006 RepID=A0A0C5WIB8_9FLAO|nr:hypothetical protein AW14_09180 [Siansivirga zeaxanthinifaciens CC-SAMT-1]
MVNFVLLIALIFIYSKDEKNILVFKDGLLFLRLSMNYEVKIIGLYELTKLKYCEFLIMYSKNYFILFVYPQFL